MDGLAVFVLRVVKAVVRVLSADHVMGNLWVITENVEFGPRCVAELWAENQEEWWESR